MGHGRGGGVLISDGCAKLYPSLQDCVQGLAGGGCAVYRRTGEYAGWKARDDRTGFRKNAACNGMDDGGTEHSQKPEKGGNRGYVSVHVTHPSEQCLYPGQRI